MHDLDTLKRLNNGKAKINRTIEVTASVPRREAEEPVDPSIDPAPGTIHPPHVICRKCTRSYELRPWDSGYCPSCFQEVTYGKAVSR